MTTQGTNGTVRAEGLRAEGLRSVDEPGARPDATVRPAHTGSSALLIEIRGLRKSYAEAGRTRIVLDAIDLDLRAGEFVCLLGKSGSGKSTLLNLISGIDAPDAGDVTLHADGERVTLTTLSERARTLFRRRNIGIIFQFFNLIPTLTVVENVRLPLELAGRADGGAAAELLAAVGLGDRLDTYPDRLSGGEQQRVAIARALIHDPLLILADEPTGNLDDDTGESVLELLLRLTRGAGKTLIMATHAPEIAARADRVLHVVHGHLQEEHLQKEGQAV
ncbi:MAG: ABC transporter ATP-binding protein [Litorilinea sp.]